jgi:hypothetical protein
LAGLIPCISWNSFEGLIAHELAIFVDHEEIMLWGIAHRT